MARIWRNCYGKSMTVPQKLKYKIKIITWSSNSASVNMQKSLKAGSQTYLYVHIHSRIIHNSPKAEATQLPMGRWMDKQKESKHTMAVNRKKMLTHARTGITPDILLHEISQTPEDKQYVIPVSEDCMIGKQTFMESEHSRAVARGWKGQEEGAAPRVGSFTLAKWKSSRDGWCWWQCRVNTLHHYALRLN